MTTEKGKGFVVTSLEKFQKGRYTYYRIYVPRDIIEEILGWKDVKNVMLIPTILNGELCLLVKRYG